MPSTGMPSSNTSVLMEGKSSNINAVGATGEDNTGGLFLPDGLHGLGIGHDLAVNVALTHTAGDKLVVLAAKVHN